jgi:simple sugar transport system permease protein
MIDVKKSLLSLAKKNEFYLFIILAILSLFMSSVNRNFGTLENFFNIIRSATFIGICSLGFLVVLICSGTDISFTATATIAQYVMAMILLSRPNIPIILVLIVPMLIGAVLGSVNAILLNSLKVPAIIICIAMLNIYYGGIQSYSRGEWLYGFPDWFIKFPNILLIKFKNADGVDYGLSTLTFLWIIVAIVTYVLLNYTMIGRSIYALGGNPVAATREGINVKFTLIFAYAYLGFISGIGAIVQAMMTQTAAPNALVGQELNAVAAVVLGGASIMGGGGTVSGTLLGVVLIATLRNGLTVMGVQSYWHQVFIGIALVISISVTATRERLLKKNAGGINIER